jgi:hypothetical protein
MRELDEILEKAATDLVAANSEDGGERLRYMGSFMMAFEKVARLMPWPSPPSQALRLWAIQNALLLMDTRRALEDWSLESGRLFYGGGEEEAERALERRSRFQLACDVFRETAAEDWLEAYASDEVDQDYREQAEQCGLDPPDWVPRSHTWWRWRDR